MFVGFLLAHATTADHLVLLQAQLERANWLLAKMGASTPEPDQRLEAVGTAVLADTGPADAPCCCHSDQIIRQKSTYGGCMDNN